MWFKAANRRSFVGGSDAGLSCAIRYFRRERRGLRNRTPSPVPFSSMKSMPAEFKAAFN